ncbi:hypothetical protein [Streptomyces sp. B21-083]|uniref:hypothetical protein n=1 Tax=Streptomyces sp. B21-083 TaxID=3039410 RepID=UPI002FF14166
MSGPLSQRWTAARAKKAGHVVLNSVVFRSSEEDVTTAGTWIEMFTGFSQSSSRWSHRRHAAGSNADDLGQGS